MSSEIFENEPRKICSHLSEKGPIRSDKAEYHTNEGEGKEKL